MTDMPPPFVLVHGGRHGGWCWRRVASRLRADGHEVYTPTLTGLGERSHLLNPDIGLATHVRDVVAVFEFEDIKDAVLVAHSYSGVVVTGAMEYIADRVRSLVLVDAPLPLTGETPLDILGPERAAAFVANADNRGEGWYVPPDDASFYGVSDPADIAWVNSKMTAQPLRTYTEPVGRTERAWAHPGTFIECRPSALSPLILARVKERSAADERFRYRVIDAPHDAMVTAPGALTHLLLDAARLA